MDRIKFVSIDINYWVYNDIRSLEYDIYFTQSIIIFAYYINSGV